jgi:hypothetical protein
MGEFCVHHEQQHERLAQRRFQRLVSATAVAVLASLGAVITRAYWR